LDPTELLKMYLERGVAAQTLWFDYATITMLILAFLAAFKPTEDNKQVRRAVFVVFGLLVAINAHTQWEVTDQRKALNDCLVKAGSHFPLHDPNVWLVLGAHLVADAAVVLVMLAIHFRAAKAPKPPVGG
jgi:hypothetical protein